MTAEKPPLRVTGGKHTASNSHINSHSNKLSCENSVWNVICEGANCGWSAQFATGREAGEAGWAYHRTVYHNKITAKSVNTCDGAATHIFKTVVRNKNAQVARSRGTVYQATNERGA